MTNQDIRWEQRFNNFLKALSQLEKSVKFIRQCFLEHSDSAETDDFAEIQNNLLKQGLIQSFEFTHELAWKVIKDYAEFQGNNSISGSRDAAREGFSMGLISNGEVWMEMIYSRNATSHTYNEDIAEGIYGKIISDYLQAFLELKVKLEEIKRNS